MRKIVHIDMDAFYASVEQRDNPEYRNRPLVVGGRPDQRGVVAACSYEARKFGIHSAMPSSRAANLCGDVIFIAPRFDAYRQASEGIRDVFQRFTSVIEPLSLDEAYLDVTEVAARFGSATEVARKIKTQIKETVNLTASAGVSYNKFLAKIASDMDKPDGLYVIRPEVAQQFVEQLEVRKFFGIGKVTEKKMQALGIYTGADLKRLSEIQLQTQFGQLGTYYYQIARGIDDRPVCVQRRRKSLSNETTFTNNVLDKKQIWGTLKRLASNLAELMQEKNLVAGTVTLKIRYSDFQSITRSLTGESPVKSQAHILAALPTLLKRTEVGLKPIRLIGITLAKIQAVPDTSPQETVGQQLGLF